MRAAETSDLFRQVPAMTIFAEAGNISPLYVVPQTWPLAVSVARGVRASPKNLIFASQIKPDLRFRDAINNDVETVTNTEKVLIYDRPIGAEGLCWKALQDWWSDRESVTGEVAKRTLYKRLLESLPDNSPPQRTFFESYFRHFQQAIPSLPALLPEVWLHWDPKTAKERGTEALLRFRMDFLMLLPNSVRSDAASF